MLGVLVTVISFRDGGIVHVLVSCLYTFLSLATLPFSVSLAQGRFEPVLTYWKAALTCEQRVEFDCKDDISRSVWATFEPCLLDEKDSKKITGHARRPNAIAAMPLSAPLYLIYTVAGSLPARSKASPLHAADSRTLDDLVVIKLDIHDAVLGNRLHHHSLEVYW